MDERRRYFRIDDEFQVRLTPAGTRRASSSVSDEAKELHSAMARLRNRLPEVADLLSLIERRVVKLEQATEQGSATSRAAVVQGTNISGCGVAFHSEQQLAADTELELDLVLDEGKLELRATGRVVSCVPAAADGSDTAGPADGRYGWLARVDLVDIDAGDEETLVQYVLQRQVRRLRIDRGNGRALGPLPPR